MKYVHGVSLRVLSVILVLTLLGYSACKKDNPTPEPEPTAEEVALGKLKGAAWVLGSGGVKVDDVVVDLYAGLSIAFTDDKKYTSVNGGVLWPASGTWSFKSGSDGTIIVRDDGLEVTIAFPSASTLTLTFTRTGDTVFEPGGRKSAVGGKHVITLGR